MTERECPIWQTPAKEIDYFAEGAAWMDSPRAGGIYIADRYAVRMLPSLSPEERAKLTTWIVDQHRAGVVAPLVTDPIIREIRERRPLRTSERIARLFLLLSHRRFKPDDVIQFNSNIAGPPPRDFPEFGAWLESVSDRDTLALVRLLLDEELLKQPNSNQMFLLTAKGFARLEQMESAGAGLNQVFVAMWFDESMESAYAEGIGPAISDAGYTPFRIDKKEHANKIDDEIVAEIKRSKFLIADFTCPVFEVNGAERPNGRGGVYYEAGFAQGLGIPVIWSCRHDCLPHVHFDTRQYSHVVWNTPAELRVGLYNRIAAHIGITPDASGRRAS